MLNLNSRQKDLIKLMINESNYKTMNEYAGILKISPRTLYSDIEIINNHLKSFQTEIQKKPRVGIKLCGNHQEKMKLLKSVNSKCDIENQYSTEERHFEIMKMLLIDEQTISYQKLADYFWVSKTSICNDMDLIQGSLNDRTVGIESDKKGTRIVGSEAQKQYTLQIYTENMLNKSNISNEEDFLKYGPEILKKIYPEDIVDTVLKEVEKFEKNQNIYLSYTYLKSLVVTIIVFVFRLSRKSHITFKKNFIFEEIKSLETYFIAETMLNSISQKLNIDIIKDDIDYLNKQLLAHSINPEINDEKEIKKYHDMVKEAVDEMSSIMSVDLRHDEKLYKGLMLHIIPMIYRLDMGIRLQNPMLNEIKEQYSVTLNATWYVMAKLAGKLNITLTEDEVAFLMVHFQVSIDRNAKVKKILIVCPTGIGSSELIANKIKRFLPAKDIIEVVSIRQLYENNIKNVDLIISSVTLDIKDKPVVYVSSLVSNNDIKNISKYYTDIFIDDKSLDESVEEEYLKFEHIKNLIYKKLIFTNYNCTSPEECLSYMIDSFEREGLTNDGFKKSILEREKLGSTSLDSAVAIPHALPQTVKKSALGIMTLKNYIRWGNKNVNTIILISISLDDIKSVKSILSEVYNIVESKEKVDRIFLNKSKEEIYETLGRC